MIQYLDYLLLGSLLVSFVPIFKSSFPINSVVNIYSDRKLLYKRTLNLQCIM